MQMYNPVSRKMYSNLHPSTDKDRENRITIRTVSKKANYAKL